MGRKRKNFGEMSVANGKIWNDQELNFGKKSLYNSLGAINSCDYEQKLRSLNKIDLDKHATDLCVLPRENKESLITELLKGFIAVN